ncbi:MULTISPECIES: BLUF domain-containing protein [unclassified Sphingomonas]|uniref:BLUF domain-containing protein n=1 Tax=unclassified Sphingomonas TaxID=196159 RepID=UPI0006FFD472|nr:MULTISPECIES: BLUF domain-containing protein [unclassified Sphingomonas]KQX19260.1 blue light sensor protein [Sphingomonas sp. Root1294]KQY65464.1 blue light sensor protein [Sphingomonas sp. Root50]KRB95237.1 blue light sensor protein [Sphingomonas sp. Root720]
MYQSLIYVSRSRLQLPSQAEEIDRIVSGSIERNARLEVRGALIFTERHFAQLLEGPPGSIAELMDSIRRDWRHESVTVIENKPIDGYRFPDWSLAYWGDASYMDQHVARVLDKADALNRTQQTTDLYELLQKLAQASHDQDGPVGRPSSH